MVSGHLSNVSKFLKDFVRSFLLRILVLIFRLVIVLILLRAVFLEDVCGNVTCSDNNNQIVEHGVTWSSWETESHESWSLEDEDDEQGGDYAINIFCCSPIQEIQKNKSKHPESTEKPKSTEKQPPVWGPLEG